MQSPDIRKKDHQPPDRTGNFLLKQANDFDYEMEEDDMYVSHDSPNLQDLPLSQPLASRMS